MDRFWVNKVREEIMQLAGFDEVIDKLANSKDNVSGFLSKYKQKSKRTEE